MVEVATEFVLIDGDLPVHEARRRLEDRHQAVVVHVGGTFWVCTPAELSAIVEKANPNAKLVSLMFEYRPALTIDAAPTAPPDRRIVITDGAVVSGVVLIGPLERDMPTTAPSPPHEVAAPQPSPVEEIHGDGAVSAGRDLSYLGPSRGLDEERDGTAEPWHLETRFPRDVSVGSVTSLTVELTREPGDERDMSTLPVELSAGTTVGVLVQPGHGFEIMGPSEGIVEASDETLPIRFRLRAIEEGKGKVRVLFFVESTALGTITLEPVIRAEGTVLEETPVPSSTIVSALNAGSAPPDLELVVLEDTSNGRPAYSIRVTSETLGYHLREFGPIVLHTDARSYFADLFAEIEALDLGTPDDRAHAQTILEAKGDGLFRDLIPEALREELWRARDQIVRIRVDSEEPHIPWELIRLSGPDEKGDIVPGRFLCEYEMTRWILGPGLQDELGMTSFGIVVPDDSDLASAREEKAFLTGLSGSGRSVTEVPATFEDVMAAFTEGRHDVWHFSGHGVVRAGQDPNRFAIHLDDGDRFTPNEISGPRANVGKAAPLVFLNACQVGQTGMSLTGLGGWAQQFLEVGAAGFIGAMWNVHDNPARDFAKAFYTRLLEGDTIGAATLHAREEIRRYQDATWLAYTVYGHPSAALAPTKE